jgi:hypothetical protein
MPIVICPGIHEPELTQAFLAGVKLAEFEVLVFPAPIQPAYSGLHILQFLQANLSSKSDLVLISFSAGVVGAIAAAHFWQQSGGQVQAFFAMDGWGAPLWGNFPIHRLSHDYFTHWTAALLGTGTENFYAEPSVAHLELWRSPQTTMGQWTFDQNYRPSVPITAADFLKTLLQRYAY